MPCEKFLFQTGLCNSGGFGARLLGEPLTATRKDRYTGFRENFLYSRDCANQRVSCKCQQPPRHTRIFLRSARTLPYYKYYGHINSRRWWPNTPTAVKHYGSVSERPCFPGENSQEISTNRVNSYGDSKLLCRSIFNTAGPFGLEDAVYAVSRSGLGVSD